MTTATLGVDVDVTSTTAQFALGTVGWEGGKAYMYVQANGAITGDGYVVSFASDFDAIMTDTDTAATVAEGRLIGVAETAFADNEYGWVQVYGACGVRSEQDALANAYLGPTADGGQVDDAGATANYIAGLHFRTATGGADAVNSTAFLNWPRITDRPAPAT